MKYLGILCNKISTYLAKSLCILRSSLRLRVFVKFMFRKTNDSIWGGNERLCSLNRAKRVLFTVSGGWTRHAEWDEYRRRGIYSARWWCDLSRGVVAYRSLWLTAAVHQLPYHRSSLATASAPEPKQPQPAFSSGLICRSHRAPPARSRLSFIFIPPPQLDGSSATRPRPSPILQYHYVARITRGSPSLCQLRNEQS